MLLVVDNDHAITQLLYGILVKEGYRVRTAANGEDAYAILQESECKGMLLDMIMPGINGAGLLMLMASEGIKLPVVIVAGGPDLSEDELREFPNVVGFLRKPFYPEEALAMVRRHMAPPSPK